jgi:hypothetical protein
MASSFRDLRVWQEAMTLTAQVYRSTAEFPKSEIYGLAQQMRRVAVSVPSNIAEGKGHRSARNSFTSFFMRAVRFGNFRLKSYGHKNCDMCRSGRVPVCLRPQKV